MIVVLKEYANEGMISAEVYVIWCALPAGVRALSTLGCALQSSPQRCGYWLQLSSYLFTYILFINTFNIYIYLYYL